MEKKEKFTFIDLFAGIGGTRLGFEKVGGKCVFSSEWDKEAQKTYQANFREIPHGDITKIEVNSIPNFDILVAGFPCQPFSMIGKREGFKNKTQGTLFYDIVRIIQGKEPKAFLLENVKGLTHHDKGNTFKVILETLDELGYHVYDKILDASDFGLPQVRKRIYIVGIKKDLFEDKPNFRFPEGFQNDVYINQFLEENVSDRSISEHLQKTYISKHDDGHPQIVNKNSKVKAKTLVASYHKIQRITGTFVKDGPTGLRLLTEKECKALMGFPEEFKVPVSRTQMYRQFGNSVAVPVVEAIAKEMTKLI